MLYTLNQVLQEWKEIKVKKEFYHYLSQAFEPQYNNELSFVGFKRKGEYE